MNRGRGGEDVGLVVGGGVRQDARTGRIALGGDFERLQVGPEDIVAVASISRQLG